MAKTPSLFSKAGLRKATRGALQTAREAYREFSSVQNVETTISMSKEQAKSLVRLGINNHEYRTASDLAQNSEQYTAKWQETFEAANVVYATYASLGRIANGEAHQDSVENFANILNTINAGGTNNIHLDQGEAVDRIARKLIAAERGGIRDLKQAGITAHDIQILTVAVNTLEQKIDEGVPEALENRAALKVEKAKLERKLTGRRGSFYAFVSPDAAKADQERLTELQTQVSQNVDFAILQADAKIANDYVRDLSADIARQLNPSFAYDAKAVELDPDVEELGEAAVLNMAVGDAAAAVGLFTKAHQDESGNVQAIMIALRNKAEASKGAAKKVSAELGEFGGDIDFLGIAFKSDAERKQLLADFGVSDPEFTLAQKTVEEAFTGNGDVNAGKRIKVPGIGIIQEKMYAKSIPSYPDFKTGILIGQRAIESTRAVLRIQEAKVTGDLDTLDSAKGAKRGFNWNPKFDQPETIQAVQLAETINDIERTLEDGRKIAFPPEMVGNIAQKYDFASAYLHRAGQTHLANETQALKERIFRIPALPEKAFKADGPGLDKS